VYTGASKYTRYILFAILFLIALAPVYYLLTSNEITNTALQIQQKRQLELARAEAANLTAFFDTFGQSIGILSQSSSINSYDAITSQELEVFVDQWADSGIIGGLVLTNEAGTVEYNPNIQNKPNLGASLADRDYFKWSQSAQDEEYFIGDPVISRLGASKSQTIIPVASPVFSDGEFAGVVAASVILQPLANKYLEFLKISEYTDVYLLDNSGQVIYTNQSDIDAPAVQKIIDTIPDKQLSSEKETVKITQDYLITLTDLPLNNQNWILAVSSPNEASTQNLSSFYVRRIAILLIVYLTVVSVVVIAIVERERTLKKLK